MSDCTISEICYYCKFLVFFVFAIIVKWCWQKKYISVLVWFAALCVVEKKYYTIRNGAPVPPFHCIMIDWLWVFNAVSAILQS